MKKVARETMTFSDLPRELESEILSRVPATSLAQLRFTCKRWYALFKNPRFVEENSSTSPTTPQVIFKKSFKVHSVNLNLHEPSIEFTGKFNCLNHYSKHVEEISEIFVCDSLLLCITKEYRLVVWNPCTGQTKWIQPENRKTFYDTYALGYETNNTFCSSYKILRYSHYDNDRFKPMVGYEIYEFSSDTWRFIKDDMISRYFGRIKRGDVTGVSLKGNTYWATYSRYYGLLVIRFDFKRERFERLSLVSELNNYDYFHDVKLSVVRQEKLSVLAQLHLESASDMFKILVTDAKISEAKDGSEIQCSLLLDLGPMMPKKLRFVNSFLVDEENKRVVCCCGNRVCIIELQDLEIHECQQLHEELKIAQRPIRDYFPLLVTYIPSLVQI